MKPPRETPTEGVQRASGLVNNGGAQMMAFPERSWKFHTPSLTPCLMHPFYFAVAEFYPF